MLLFFDAVVVVIVALDDKCVVVVVVVDMIYPTCTLLFTLKPILKYSAQVKTVAIGPITYPLPTISFK